MEHAVGPDQMAEDLDPHSFQERVHNLGLDVIRACEQQKPAQSEQRLCYSFFWKVFYLDFLGENSQFL